MESALVSGDFMTLILNLLHKDMSILAADRKAIAEWPVSMGSRISVVDKGSLVVNNFNKITLNASGSLALGIAGRTQDHSYTQKIESSVSVDDGLIAIRKHMECFLCVHDRSGLRKLTEFAINQSIVSFFDGDTGMYFSNTFLFSPIHNETRLHRATDGAKIFHAGSGSGHFEKAVGLAEIDSFLASTKAMCTVEECIPWMRMAFSKVSASDIGSGADAMFVVSTRSSPKFHLVECY